MTVETEFLRVAKLNFRSQKNLGDKSFEQLNDDEFHFSPDEESNSIAVIIQHLHGNMISRFTDFLTTDGEKPNRNRDSEFVEKKLNKSQLMEIWEKGWKLVFDTIDRLKPDEILNTVYIRNEPHTVLEALSRQVSHYGYHVGQIVFLAKHIRNKNWKTLSIARGKSDEFNQKMNK
jgi:hypothetical protein